MHKRHHAQRQHIIYSASIYFHVELRTDILTGQLTARFLAVPAPHPVILLVPDYMALRIPSHIPGQFRKTEGH